MEIRPLFENESLNPLQGVSPLWEGIKSYEEKLKQALNDLNPDFTNKKAPNLSLDEAEELVAAVYQPVARAATLSQDPLINKVSRVFNAAKLDTTD